MKKKLFILVFILFHYSFSQWSTSTNADSALFVCPGFEPGILSLSDGSSYIAGGLSDYLYVQKLDPRGYKLWPQPVQIFSTPGTGNFGFFTMVSDGLGGLIFVWKDYRGAYVGPDDYYNNAIYMQRVDKNGNILWQSNGVQVASVDGGNKEATVVNDGSGGAILMIGESDFQRPGAAGKERIWIQHYGNNGIMKWSFPVDSSSTAFSIYPPGGAVRLNTLIRYPIRNDYRFIDTSGMSAVALKYTPKGNILSITDSLLFDIKNLPSIRDSTGNSILVTRVTRFSNTLDSIWTSILEFPDEADPNRGYGNIPYVYDGNGGLFYCLSYRDINGQLRSRIQNITPTGMRWKNYGLNIYGKSAYTIFSGKNEVGVLFGDATAQKYDTNGRSLWQDSLVVFSNASDAYSKVFASDNHGGCIIAFWTTAGGIYVQHTGRNGKLGIITSVHSYTNNSIPAKFSISQNYPNPFNPSTSFVVNVSQRSNVAVKVYDVLGREINMIRKGNLEAGAYALQWDSKNQNGNAVASGIYFYQLFIDEQPQQTRKMILIK